jgi:hypothetical protein
MEQNFKLTYMPNNVVIQTKKSNVVIDNEGLHYNGKIISDDGEIYKYLKEFLQTLQVPQQEISNEAIYQVSHQSIKYGGGTEGCIKDAFLKLKI